MEILPEMKPAVEVHDLSKSFKLRHETRGYLTLREQILNIFSSTRTASEEFVALKEVSFEMREGDSLAIIGRNGAGKSTLLKIISRIIVPGKGRVITRGRVASLLEVGTGFHPELTGRENIFFNGSLLGMRRREIKSRFDAIVNFSGVEKFLDTPLKHYSSGMQMRLAFSVAAFLEPEILIIDEILAVGDAEFQKKCIGKMEQVQRSGRTILFVSHNMAAVQKLCNKGIVLNQGRIAYEGNALPAVESYLKTIEAGTLPSFSPRLPGILIKSIEITCDGQAFLRPYMGCHLQISVTFDSGQALESPVLGVIFKDQYGLPLLAVNNKHYRGNVSFQPVRCGTFIMTIPYLTLFAGSYVLDVHFGNGFEDLEVLRDCIVFEVEPMTFSDHGELPSRQYNRFFIRDIDWKIESHECAARESVS